MLNDTPSIPNYVILSKFVYPKLYVIYKKYIKKDINVFDLFFFDKINVFDPFNLPSFQPHIDLNPTPKKQKIIGLRREKHVLC